MLVVPSDELSVSPSAAWPIRLPSSPAFPRIPSRCRPSPPTTSCCACRNKPHQSRSPRLRREQRHDRNNEHHYNAPETTRGHGRGRERGDPPGLPPAPTPHDPGSCRRGDLGSAEGATELPRLPGRAAAGGMRRPRSALLRPPRQSRRVPQGQVARGLRLRRQPDHSTPPPSTLSPPATGSGRGNRFASSVTPAPARATSSSGSGPRQPRRGSGSNTPSPPGS